jgi:hypothetical protein
MGFRLFAHTKDLPIADEIGRRDIEAKFRVLPTFVLQPFHVDTRQNRFGEQTYRNDNRAFQVESGTSMSLKSGNFHGPQRAENIQDMACSETPSFSLSRMGGKVAEKDETCSLRSWS